MCHGLRIIDIVLAIFYTITLSIFVFYRHDCNMTWRCSHRMTHNDMTMFDVFKPSYVSPAEAYRHFLHMLSIFVLNWYECNMTRQSRNVGWLRKTWRRKWHVTTWHVTMWHFTRRHVTRRPVTAWHVTRKEEIYEMACDDLKWQREMRKEHLQMSVSK